MATGLFFLGARKRQAITGNGHHPCAPQTLLGTVSAGAASSVNVSEPRQEGVAVTGEPANRISREAVPRGPLLAREILTFPLFLLITAVPWLVTTNLYLYAATLSDADHLLRSLCRIIALSSGFLTALATIWFFVVWLYHIVRRLRNRQRM